jgi:hypothetical protein
VRPGLKSGGWTLVGLSAASLFMGIHGGAARVNLSTAGRHDASRRGPSSVATEAPAQSCPAASDITSTTAGRHSA